MKIVAILALAIVALLPGAARAQAASAPAIPYCLPKTPLLNGTGTDFTLFETATVSGRLGWCPSSSGWNIVVHQWNLKKTQAPGFDTFVGDAIARVLRASDPVAQVKIEWATYGQPLTNDADRWEYASWRFQACQWLTSTQPGVSPRPAMPIALPADVKNPDGTPWLPPVGYCDPWNPGPPPSTWKATGGTIFKFASGRLTVPTVRKATAGAACDGVTKATVGSTAYQSLVGGPSDEVTGCAK